MKEGRRSFRSCTTAAAAPHLTTVETGPTAPPAFQRWASRFSVEVEQCASCQPHTPDVPRHSSLFIPAISVYRCKVVHDLLQAAPLGSKICMISSRSKVAEAGTAFAQTPTSVRKINGFSYQRKMLQLCISGTNYSETPINSTWPP